jgi:hypothetical protein
MATFAGTMFSGSQPNPQWVAADGKPYYVLDAKQTRRGATAITSAVLNGGGLSGPQQATLLANLQSTASGGFAITIDGTARDTGGLNFTSVGTLADAALEINGALAAWATFVFSPGPSGNFICTSLSAGAASTITYASAPAVGTNLSGMLMLSNGSGATISRTGAPSEEGTYGDRRDYTRRVGRFGRRRGLGPMGWIVCMPVNSGWVVSTADDANESNLASPPTVMKPPAGTK